MRAGARGFTLIELMIVIAIIAIIAAIAIPNLLAARKASNESSAIQTLRTIAAAQTIFRDRDYDRDNIPDYAAGADELSAERSVLASKFVPLVDLQIGHAAGALLFALPMAIQKVSELVEIAAFQGGGAPEAGLLYEMQVIDHRGIGSLALLILIFENLRGGTGIAREKKQ